jgi:hypothetical protein
MRTVSFSDSGVQKLLSDQFICLRLNTRGDPTAGESFSHAPQDPAGPCVRGNGQQNVQVLILTADGEIFHVTTGFVGPEDLQTELKFALATYGKLTHRQADRPGLVRDAHFEFLRQNGYSKAEIERPADDFRAMFDRVAPKLPVDGDGRLAFDGVLQGAVKSHVLADHRFVIEHPLLPMASFKPETLVGSGKSFFGSTSFGNVQSNVRGTKQEHTDR